MDDNAKKWIAVGCVASIVVACCLCGGLLFVGGGLGMMGMEGMEQVSESSTAFLSDIRSKNYAGAYARMDSPYRGSHDAAAFQRSVEELPRLATHTSAAIGGVQMINGDMEAQVRLDAPDGTANATVGFRNENGVWRVNAVTVDGQRLR